MADSMRSLNSFGVAGLLSQTCDVFYTNDLRARNIGRVSDLASAKLRESDADELRIRALLVYGIFQTYAVRGMPHHHQEEVPPASVEIGVDDANVAVAISFHWDADHVPNWNGLSERVDSGKGADPFEKILEWVYRHSTQVIVRYELAERKVEVISVLNRADSELHDPTMVVLVNSTTAPLLEVSNYVELGDLNFSKLLKNPVANDETKIDGRTPQQTLEEVEVKGAKTSEEEAVRRISGGPKEEPLSEQRFSGSKGPDVAELAAIREEYESTVSELRNTVHDLKEQLEAAEAKVSERHFTGDSPQADDEPIVVKGSEKKAEKSDDEWGIGFLKQVWPFAPKEGEKKKSDVPLDSEPESSSVTVVSGGPSDDVKEEMVISISDDSADPADAQVVTDTRTVTEAERAAEAALRQLQELAKSSKSKKLEATLNEIEAEAEPNKAKRWVDTLSSELLQEKAKLGELQRNLTKQMRQRDLEFKTAELALKQELKRKDDMLAQRQASIENKTDQIAQLNLAVERAGAATNDKESQQVKVKLDRAQRMAQMKEEEAKSLVTKVRDLENRLIIAQAKAQKGNDPQIATKMATLEKKVDEYKRINQRLMESLNSQKEKSNDKEVGDLRRKIDQLDRLLADGKRNMDKSAFKFRELQESEKKLQSDLARAVEENRNLRKAANKGSGESGGGQAA